MPTKELSRGMLKALEDIKDTAKTFGVDSTIKVKATKKKTLKKKVKSICITHFNTRKKTAPLSWSFVHCQRESDKSSPDITELKLFLLLSSFLLSSFLLWDF